jgi:hypothetical protein
MSPPEFCDTYTSKEAMELFRGADTPAGARKVGKWLDELAVRTPKRIRSDVELMAKLYGEIADAKGDEDKIAQIDTSRLQETADHLQRWQKKHC